MASMKAVAALCIQDTISFLTQQDRAEDLPDAAILGKIYTVAYIGLS